ncbi:MAG: PD40 domain-containing protein [Deltaproteobacteria bacterium]|nr:PD40 domain-containing protein [Deltaproteobacteria bacterium]
MFAALVVPTFAHAERLVETREIVRGDFLAPQYSPDGRQILLTASQLRGLYVLADGSVSELTDAAEAGVHAKWTSDGSIHYRALSNGTRRDLVIGRDRAIRAAAATSPVAFTQDDRMYVVDRSKRLARIGSGDRFFGAVIAPDGDKVVFQGLETGLYLYIRSSGALRYIGPGTAPSWSPDSTRLAYEVTEDDGHMIVASDLYIYTLAADRAEPVTTTDRAIERRPSFAPSGNALVFDDNTGGIFVGRLEAR